MNVILNRPVNKYVFPICYMVPTESVNIQMFAYDVCYSGIRIYHILDLWIITVKENTP